MSVKLKPCPFCGGDDVTVKSVTQMRAIKFRGRDDEGQWHFGFLSWYSDVLACICDGADYEVEPETVGQKTCFRDSEGKEMYEGDVLEYKTWAETGERYVTMGEVRFVQDQFLVVGPKDIEVQGLFSVAHEPALSDLLVLGNIHDNPELLEVKNA